MGDPDLSAEPDDEPRRGLVIFPVQPPGAARRSGWAGDWRLVIAALLIAALVIAVALLVP